MKRRFVFVTGHRDVCGERVTCLHEIEPPIHRAAHAVSAGAQGKEGRERSVLLSPSCGFPFGVRGFAGKTIVRFGVRFVSTAVPLVVRRSACFAFSCEEDG